MAGVRPLSKIQLVWLSVRSVLIQSSWNFKQFQGLGWMCLLLPELKRLYSVKTLRPVVQRYLGYFNSNIFLVPTIAAAVLSLERHQRLEQPVAIAPQAFAESVMAPVAAAGDAFFWGGLRPLCCAVAVLVGGLGYWWSPVVFLVLFNGPAFMVRFVGPWLGYQQGVQTVLLLQKLRIADVAILFKRLTVVVLGGIVAVNVHAGSASGLMSLAVAVGVLLALLGIMVAVRKKVPLVVIITVLIGGVFCAEQFF